jgi:hypothetical protein
LVWARNPESKIPSAREWHWIDFHTIARAGLAWQPATVRTGRWVNTQGYAQLTRRGLTTEDLTLALEHDLFFGGPRKTRVMEHQLVAVKKYGRIPPGWVVRHRNGVKSDNLVLGSKLENNMDHETARLEAIFWRERCERAEHQLVVLGLGLPA